MKCLLKDIVEVRSGVFLKTVPEGDIFYLQVSDFDSEGIYQKGRKPVIPYNLRLREHMLEEGDLLFAAKGTSNFCVVFRNEWGRAVASSSFFVIRIMDKQFVLPEFLCWFLNLPQVVQRLKAKAVGSSILSITKKMLEEVELDLPHLSLQQKIIALVEMQQREQHLYQMIASKKKELLDKVFIELIKTDGK